MADQEATFEGLLRASLIGDSSAVIALLESGVEVNGRDQNGWSPLLEAVFGGHRETIVALLDRGAEVNTCDQIGWTPLMEAASKGRFELVRILLAYGADVQARTIENWSALQVTPAGNKQIRQLLREVEKQLLFADEEASAPGLPERPAIPWM
jgi:uncharacterized protein